MSQTEAEAETEVVARLHGIEVLRAPMLGPGMIASMNEGRYERQEIACGLAAIKPGARILEMGAGLGVVGAVLAKNCQPASVLTIEANPDLLPWARRLYAHNGVEGVITLRHAVVISDPQAPTSMSFNITGNFLGSSLLAVDQRKSRSVEVPVQSYQSLKQDYPHDVIMMDIEGAELEFLRHADLTGVELFILEMHRNHYGREGMRECRHLLDRAGLVLDESQSKSGVHVWRRR